MKRLICATLAWLLLAGTVAFAAPSQGKSKSKKHSQAEQAKSGDGTDVRVNARVVFSSGEITIIRDHYAPRYRHLPPGLQKKVARGGQLPPGWRKKFEPFPVVVERRLAVLPPSYRRGVIDGHAVIYNTRSNVIIDVAVLF
jgi:hypothetical protein